MYELLYPHWWGTLSVVYVMYTSKFIDICIQSDQKHFYTLLNTFTRCCVCILDWEFIKNKSVFPRRYQFPLSCWLISLEELSMLIAIKVFNQVSLLHFHKVSLPLFLYVQYLHMWRIRARQKKEDKKYDRKLTIEILKKGQFIDKICK